MQPSLPLALLLPGCTCTATMGEINRDSHLDLHPKLGLGFLSLPVHQDYRDRGAWDLLEKSDFRSDFLRSFKMNHDELGKVEEVKKCLDILTYPDLYRLIPTYLDLSLLISTFPELCLLFHLLILATILENPADTTYPGTQKVRIN